MRLVSELVCHWNVLLPNTVLAVGKAIRAYAQINTVYCCPTEVLPIQYTYTSATNSTNSVKYSPKSAGVANNVTSYNATHQQKHWEYDKVSHGGVSVYALKQFTPKYN